jgi:hypothetical protein
VGVAVYGLGVNGLGHDDLGCAAWALKSRRAFGTTRAELLGAATLSADA